VALQDCCIAGFRPRSLRQHLLDVEKFIFFCGEATKAATRPFQRARTLHDVAIVDGVSALGITNPR